MFGCLHPTCMEMFVMSGFVRHWLPKYSPCSFKKLFDLLGCFTLDSFFSVSLLSERLSPVKFDFNVVAIAIQLLADYTDTMVHYLTLSSQVRMDWIILSDVVERNDRVWREGEPIKQYGIWLIYSIIYIYIIYIWLYMFKQYQLSISKTLPMLRIPCVRSWLQTHSWGDHPLGWTRGRRRGGR